MKSPLLVIFLCITSFTLVAQTNQIGIEGGINISNTSNNEGYFEPLLNTQFAITYTKSFSNKLSFNVDINYIRYGVIIDKALQDDLGSGGPGTSDPDVDNNDPNRTYQYLELPLKLGYQFGSKLKVTPAIGLVPGVLLKAQRASTNGTNEINTNDVRKFNIAISSSIGVGVAINDRIELRITPTYRHSLTRFTTDDHYSNSDLKFRAFSLTTGLMCKL